MSLQSTTQRVIRISANSPGYDVIEYAEVDTPKITKPNQVLVKNKYLGVNFIEAYFRKGDYPAQLPYTLGREALGVVIGVGKDVTKYKVGDNVAYLQPGSFAQYVVFDDDKVQVIKLKSQLNDEEWKTFGLVLIQGLTAITFVEEAHKVEKDQYVLVWAAAGGVGQLLVQLLKLRGAKVIAIALTEDKLKLAQSLGADYLINSSKQDITAEVDKITNGAGVNVLFDSIGKDSFETLLAAVARKGSFVSYGNALGLVPPFSINRLLQKNIKLSRPTLFNYVATQPEWDHYLKQLVELIEGKKLKFDITKVYDLADYKQAAQDLEGRKTTGKVTLKIPQ